MKTIAIHSVPRSGSTWLGNIFNSHPSVIYKYQPHFSYEFKNVITPDATPKTIEIFFKNIASYNSDFLDQTQQKKEGLVPHFEKFEYPTHIVYKEVRYHHLLTNMLAKSKDLKAILLIRNPLAVLNSWWHAPKEFRKDLNWDFLNEWQFAPSKNQNKIEEYNGYFKWKEAAILFHGLKEEYPDRVSIIKYSDLLNKPKVETEQLFNFVGLQMTDQTKDFIHLSQSSHHEDAYAVYKKRKKDTQWQGKLPETIGDFVFQDLRGSLLETYLDD